MTVIELPDEQVAALKAKAAAEGLSLEAWLQKLAEQENLVFVERRPEGDYAVRRSNATKASAVLPTQAEAIDRAREMGSRELVASRPRRHIADVILENMQDVPPEIMARMPEDGASQHDHYIYGWPKKEA